METRTIRAIDLKKWPGSVTTERLQRAAAEGVRVLDVNNRGRPVAHLALAEEMPAEWRTTGPATVPLSELKQSEVSISRLRREGRALYLSQRNGPKLALWPVEAAYTRTGDLSPAEEADYLRREFNKLRREVERLQRRDRAIVALIKLAAKMIEDDVEPEKEKAAPKAKMSTSPKKGKSTPNRVVGMKPLFDD
jgi:hypothetical protein